MACQKKSRLAVLLLERPHRDQCGNDTRLFASGANCHRPRISTRVI